MVGVHGACVQAGEEASSHCQEDTHIPAEGGDAAASDADEVRTKAEVAHGSDGVAVAYGSVVEPYGQDIPHNRRNQ